VLDAFAGASPTEGRAFEIERDGDGRPMAFWDTKALFLAVVA